MNTNSPKFASIARFGANPKDDIKTQWPGTPVKFDGKLFFRDSSPVLDRLLSAKGGRYIEFRTDDLGYAEHLNQNGLKFAGEMWKCIQLHAEDGEAHARFVSHDSGVRSLEDLDIFVHTETTSDVGKAGKYLNRYFAPGAPGARLITAISVETGTYLDRHNRLFVMDTVTLDTGLVIRVLYDDMKYMTAEEKAMVDGEILIGPAAWLALELSPDHLLEKVTLGTMHGIGKGHARRMPWGGNLVRVFGPKAQVKPRAFNGFSFLTLGKVKAGKVYTDKQSWINFRFDRKELGPALARDFMKQTLATAEDERYFRNMTQRMVLDLKPKRESEGWLLADALRRDLPILARPYGDPEMDLQQPGFPGLVSRVKNVLMDQVFDCEQARVPMEKVARYAYVMSEDAIFDEMFSIDLSHSQVGENEIVVPELEGGLEIAAYRQPNENGNAHALLTTVMFDRYEKYQGMGICLVGVGAHKVLSRLGGADLDDSFVIVFDPIWVNAFKDLPVLAETGKLADVVEVFAQESYQDQDAWDFFVEDTDLGQRSTKPYGRDQFSKALDMARRGRALLGTSANFLMHMNVLTDERSAGIIRHQLQELPEALEAYNSFFTADGKLNMENEFVVAYLAIASNFERIIDGTVKDPTLLIPVQEHLDKIKKFHDGNVVYAQELWEKIPLSRIQTAVDSEGKPTLVKVRTRYCQSIEQIREYRQMLDNLFIHMEWKAVGRFDQRVRDAYPSTKEARDLVKALKDIWYQEFTDAFEKGLSDLEMKAARVRIEGLITDELAGLDEESLRFVAVELYCQSYQHRYQEPVVSKTTGRVKSYWDRLLWTKVLSGGLMRVFDELGLSGWNAGVELDPTFLYLWNSTERVLVMNGAVLLAKSKEHVGFVPARIPDGEYTMDGGVILVKPCTLGVDQDML